MEFRNSCYLCTRNPQHTTTPGEGRQRDHRTLAARNPVSFILKCCVSMSERKYELVAWTENGEVRLSQSAMLEQEALLRDEYDSLYYSGDRSWEHFERLSYVALLWGRLLLEMEDYRAAYGRFVDGLYACRDAVRFLHVPEDGGAHPFLSAMDDLYAGCMKAALAEGGTLEEILYEDGIHDIRRQMRERVAEMPGNR